MKYLIIVCTVLLFSLSCERVVDDAQILSPEEGIVFQKDDGKDYVIFNGNEIQLITDEELLDRYKLEVNSGFFRDNTCHWADDPGGEIFGSVSCNGGTCAAGVINGLGGIEIAAIGCMNSAGEWVAIGAVRIAP